MTDRNSLLFQLREIDWDFTGTQSESPFSAIHWHPGRFASQIPATLIGLLSPTAGIILDPFVGSGTTLVEAQRLGRCGVGIDLNPISCLTSQAKTIPLASALIDKSLNAIRADAESALRSAALASTATRGRATGRVPPTVQGAKWYTSSVLNALSILWHSFDGYSGFQQILAKAAFSGILISACRETRHWGYICDNSTPKAKRSANVLSLFLQILERFGDAYRLRDRELKARSGGVLNNVDVRCCDTRVGLQGLVSESVDLVVTSPPYFGVCDYVKAQRLSLEWFGASVEELRLKEVGARSKRTRHEAGRQYLDDLRQVLEGLYCVLKKGAYGAFVIGESAKRSPMIGFFGDLLEEVGFTLVLNLNRTISSNRRQAPSLKGEHLLIGRKQ